MRLMFTATHSSLHSSSYMVIMKDHSLYLNIGYNIYGILYLTICLLSASILFVAPVDRTWFLSRPIIKPSVHGGNFLLSLSELSRI